MQIRYEKPSREELHALVWSQPMTKLAERFHMSDVALKKICKKHNIPAPPRGYWRRHECGRPGRRAKLPKSLNAAPIVIRVREEIQAVNADFLSEEEQAQIEAELSPAMAISIAEKIERPHKITTITKHALKASQIDDYGAIKCNSEEAFYVRVAPESIDRVLRIVDALVKAIEKRGYTVQPGKPPPPNEYKPRYDHAKLIINGEIIRFSIEETIRRRPHRLTEKEIASQNRASRSWNYSSSLNIPRYDFIPTEMLTLKIDEQYRSGLKHNWKDTARRRVEAQLNDVVSALIMSAAWKRRERQKEQERNRRHQTELARRAALRQQLANERSAVAQLEKNAELWRRAQVIRGFAGIVEARIRNGEATDLPMEPDAWLAWARDYANRVDPLAECKPSILDIDESEVRSISIWEFERGE